jgi:hypothetical protein
MTPLAKFGAVYFSIRFLAIQSSVHRTGNTNRQKPSAQPTIFRIIISVGSIILRFSEEERTDVGAVIIGFMNPSQVTNVVKESIIRD